MPTKDRVYSEREKGRRGRKVHSVPYWSYANEGRTGGQTDRTGICANNTVNAENQ